MPLPDSRCVLGILADHSTIPLASVLTPFAYSENSLMAGVFMEGVVYPPSSFKIVQGTLSINKRPDMNMKRVSCGKCKCMMYHEDKDLNHVVSGAEFERQHKQKPAAPSAHLYYQERVIDVHDRLPKFADLSETLGGTGNLLDTDGSPYKEKIEETPEKPCFSLFF